MIYLIGGMPRVGKSTLAQILLERDNVPWIPLDKIREAIRDAAPQLGITDGKDWWIQHHEKFYPFVRGLIRAMATSEIPYTFEGDSFLPRHADALVKEFNVRACFLGASRLDLDTLKTHRGNQYWLDDLSEKELSDLPGWIVTRSAEYKDECATLGIPYFDVSDGQQEALEKAYGYLKSGG